jgi:hypothetical protein
LLYVRYRYDESRGVRLKTVEIVVEEKPWQPSLRLRDDELVPVIVNFSEKDLREKLKVDGGKWNPEEKSWFVPYGAIRGTELGGENPGGFNQEEARGVNTSYTRCQGLSHIGCQRKIQVSHMG